MKFKDQQLICWGNSQLIEQFQQSKRNHKFKQLNLSIRIQEISCGQQHILMLSNQKKVFGIGKNSKGQLGNDDFGMQTSIPVPIIKIQNKKIKSIRCGWYHNVVLTQNNEIYTWGQGDYGALGYNNSILTKSPKKVNLLLNYNQIIKSIQCGSRYTFILTNINKIYAFGNNDLGQLGTYKQKKYFIPEAINFNQKIQQISCGISHTIFLTKEGKLFVTGSNNFGQLGLGHKQSINKITQLISSKNWLSVRCGHHSCAISNQNQLYVWGTGAFGQFLVPTRLSQQKIKKIYIGSTYGFAQSYTEKLYSWGSNISGQLAHEDFQSRSQLSLIKFINAQNIKSINCGNGFVFLMKEEKIKGMTQRQFSQQVKKGTKRKNFTRRDFSIEMIKQQKQQSNIKIQKCQKKYLELNNQQKQKNKQISEKYMKMQELIKNQNSTQAIHCSNTQLCKKCICQLKNSNNKQMKFDQIKSMYILLQSQNKKLLQQNSKLKIQKQQALKNLQKLQNDFELLCKNNLQIQSISNFQKRTDQQNIQQINQLKNMILFQTNKIKNLEYENQRYRIQISQYKLKNYFPDISLSLSQFIPLQQFHIKQIKRNYNEQITNYKKLLILKQKQITKQKKIIISGINEQLEGNVSVNDKIQKNEANYFENCISESQQHLTTLKNIINDLYNQLNI